MGQVDGFMKFDREMPKSRDPKERLKDYKEVYNPLDKEKVKQQWCSFLPQRLSTGKYYS
jgi:glutamate synthase (NADPH) small chain